jgi:hypothetical protein
VTLRVGVKHQERAQVLAHDGKKAESLASNPPTPYALIPICFEVEDTGIGIAPESLGHIFELFQQRRDRSHEGQGAGLGLAICRNLVELMGGTLQVKSTPGQGSLFWFELHLPEPQTGYGSESSVLLEDETLPEWLMRDELYYLREGMSHPVPPPPQELMRLMRWAHIGDVANIRHYAEQLKAKAGELEPFAVELERLIRGFRLDTLQNWLKSYQPDHWVGNENEETT